MSENKKSGEVTVTISGEDVKYAKGVTESPHRKSVDSHPENTFFMPSPNRPPRIPNAETLSRRKTLARSVNSKPKSRFGEQPLIDMFDDIPEPVNQTSNSPVRAASNRASPNVASFTVNGLKDYKIWSLELWKWLVLVTVIICVLWLLKTLLLKILATSFHVSNFFDRIQESIFLQYVLLMLSGPPLMESVQMVGSSTSTSQLSFQVKRKGKDVKTKDVIDVKSAYDRPSESADKEITNEMEAIAAAYHIFRNVAQPGFTYIEDLDLRRFMIKEEVDIVFPLIDVADKGQIDRKTLTEWVVKVYNDRKALAHALSDTKTAVKQLDKLVSAVLIVVMSVVWLLLTEIATTKVLVLLSSQLVVAAFIFGNTCKTIFEAIVFVFIMHPFDVGDRCVIDGVQMIVEEMNILTTVFLRYDNEKIYYPNVVLATKPISNFYRSPDMGDGVEFSIDFATPFEKIGLLKDKIKYLEKNPQLWHPNHNFVVREIENVNKIKMALFFNHTMNFQDYGEKNRRRSELVLELKKLFEELKIKCNLLPQEVHLHHPETTIGPTK
ncbi:hypothetical protein E3N88_05758 [Mikania micrantha]|uniref:Mechanosensitive ion channel MscS domain-containing protein n=1 Tax=Mikania micrantha TaxID=192012 RepID=A0A5N6PMK8_9ASTR|nr:hypothetical protein E3N88_05758 [Mikania micrantha]